MTQRYGDAPRGAALRDQVRMASGLNVLVGIWLIASPFVLNYQTLEDPFWNAIIIGAAVAVLAAIRAVGAYREAWISWINALLGIWLIASPWLLGYSGVGLVTWTHVTTGAGMAIIALWSALASRDRNAA